MEDVETTQSFLNYSVTTIKFEDLILVKLTGFLLSTGNCARDVIVSGLLFFTSPALEFLIKNENFPFCLVEVL